MPKLQSGAFVSCTRERVCEKKKQPESCDGSRVDELFHVTLANISYFACFVKACKTTLNVSCFAKSLYIFR